MALSKQLSQLINGNDHKRTYNISIGDRAIPMRFKKARNATKTLIITFHGAIDRKTREIPSFVPFSQVLGSGAHQLSIADPSMLLDGEFTLSWYAGDEGFKTQEILPQILSEMSDILEIDRTVYFGTSGGGFAALYFSWHHQGSIVVAGNPQTKISDYSARHIERYLKGCWPGTNSLADSICEDVRELYAQSFPNFVVYVQSSVDQVHLMTQMAPFLNNAKYKKDMPLIVHTDYFGKMGHSPTFDAYVPWLQAAMVTSELSVEEIVRARETIMDMQPNVQSRAKITGQQKSSINQNLVRTANAIRDWQIGKS